MLCPEGGLPRVDFFVHPSRVGVCRPGDPGDLPLLRAGGDLLVPVLPAQLLLLCPLPVLPRFLLLPPGLVGLHNLSRSSSPSAVYEAGKAAKAGYPPSVSGVPGPYSIPSVPLGGAPSSGMLMDKPHPPPLAPSDSTGGSHSVRKGYRIQADKERDSMKVLYYVEKELAQFDPARRMRGRYNNTVSELSSLHDDDNNFRQSYHQMRSKQFPLSGDLESNPDYWPGVMGGNSGTNRGPALEYNKEDRESFRHSQPRSKSEMLSRKNFATGVPAVSMDELAAFADSYGQRSRRANGNSHEARTGSRFERSESRAHGPFYQDGSLDEYYGRSREPPGDGERGWPYSPARRRPPEDAPLPRLVSRTPGTAPKYDHSYLSSVLERQGRSESTSRGGSLETPSKLGAQLGPRSASYYAWSPPATYKAGASEGEDEDDAADDDALPPYSELELSRAPSYRGRDLPFHSNSEKRRKKEPAKKTMISAILILPLQGTRDVVSTSFGLTGLPL
ncbi:hypothetical protein U0070_009459 [Myodes glareolus]|uniref:Uncharacterized protein n=1 Tax=Myodes glareolus TaxID=447135 RepID=A0AAW0HXT0_MYOGA